MCRIGPITCTGADCHACLMISERLHCRSIINYLLALVGLDVPVDKDIPDEVWDIVVEVELIGQTVVETAMVDVRTLVDDSCTTVCSLVV